jgi:hypothetical protein
MVKRYVIACKNLLTSTFFNEEGNDGVAVEQVTELYDNDFKLINSLKTLTNNKGNY